MIDTIILSHPLLLLPLLLTTLGVFLLTRRQSKYARLPPGPKPHWLFGNDFPKLYPWRYFETLTQEYGEVFTIWQGRTPMVVIGRVEAAQEILEKKAGATADRPPQIAGNTMSGGMRILLVGYGDRWRKMRKVLHSHLQPQSAKSYEPTQTSSSLLLLSSLLSHPSHFQSHIKSYAATIVLSIAYGRTTPASYTEPSVVLVNKCGDRLGQALRPGAFAVDKWPWLRWVPEGVGRWLGDPGGMGRLRAWHADELGLFKGEMLNARKNLAEGKAQPCFTSFISQKQKEYQLNDDEISYLCGSLFGAGSDTSASAITIAVMAAATFPSAQAMVQEEIDRVVGRDRAPTFSDQAEMPVTMAFVKETYRWRPVSSGGFQHATTEDIVYKEHLIPAGTIVLGNHWSIHRDPQYFPNPEVFDITRWLIRDENAVGGWVERRDLKHFQFGFGRRICPGQHIADRSVFINTANILWAFDVRNPVDPVTKQEKKIDTLAFTNTANSHPLPFEVSITPRWAGMEEVLKGEMMGSG